MTQRFEEARDYVTQAGYRVLAGSLPEKTAYRRASDEGRSRTETRFPSLNRRSDELAQGIVDLITQMQKERQPKAMANLLPPAKKSRKGLPPAVELTVGDLEKSAPGSLKPLNFKVPADFHREFKVYASQQGISMPDLLQEGFKSVREHRG